MKSRAQVFVWTFMLSGMVSFAIGGCDVEACASCETPSQPSGKARYSLQTLEAFDTAGNPVKFGVNMSDGSVTLDERKVTIQYDRRGTSHTIEYDVVPN